MAPSPPGKSGENINEKTEKQAKLAGCEKPSQEGQDVRVSGSENGGCGMSVCVHILSKKVPEKRNKIR